MIVSLIVLGVGVGIAPSPICQCWLSTDPHSIYNHVYELLSQISIPLSSFVIGLVCAQFIYFIQCTTASGFSSIHCLSTGTCTVMIILCMVQAFQNLYCLSIFPPFVCSAVFSLTKDTGHYTPLQCQQKLSEFHTYCVTPTSDSGIKLIFQKCCNSYRDENTSTIVHVLEPV